MPVFLLTFESFGGRRVRKKSGITNETSCIERAGGLGFPLALPTSWLTQKDKSKANSIRGRPTVNYGAWRGRCSHLVSRWLGQVLE
jgi:hypothetical protein